MSTVGFPLRCCCLVLLLAATAGPGATRELEQALGRYETRAMRDRFWRTDASLPTVR